MTEPRYRFLGHACTTAQATDLPNNLVLRDVPAESLVVRQRTQQQVRLIPATRVVRPVA